MKHTVSRRNFLPLAASGALGCSRKPQRQPGPPGNSAVAVIKAASYEANLQDLIERGIRECGLAVRGKRVLLKPNLVEFDSRTCINTDFRVVAAAVEVFHRLGAAEVLLGEGPGHRRDTLFLAEETGYRSGIPHFDRRFTDLNRDDVTPVPAFAGESEIYLPNTALAADLVVSLAKMKTHHWAGATLSMKNFFGLVPGCIYGWPKNRLHYLGIERSIVGLNRIFRRTFAIVDGIVGMEGNGPIQGTPKLCGALVMGQDLVAVDATCCRIMGLEPSRIPYLAMASDLGHLEAHRIEQRGENLGSWRDRFQVIDSFRHLISPPATSDYPHSGSEYLQRHSWIQLSSSANSKLPLQLVP